MIFNSTRQTGPLDRGRLRALNGQVKLVETNSTLFRVDTAVAQNFLRAYIQ